MVHYSNWRTRRLVELWSATWSWWNESSFSSTSWTTSCPTQFPIDWAGKKLPEKRNACKHFHASYLIDGKTWGSSIWCLRIDSRTQRLLSSQFDEVPDDWIGTIWVLVWWWHNVMSLSLHHAIGHKLSLWSRVPVFMVLVLVGVCVCVSRLIVITVRT